VPSKRPPPPPPPQDLDEVERALSVLGGRHPEHEKTRRETLEAARKRGTVVAAELAANARRRRRRAFVLAANGAAIAAVAYVAWRLSARTAAIHAGLERAEAAWLARGFSEVASNAVTASRTLEVDLPASSCFAVVTEADGPLRLRQGDATTEAARSIAGCACGAARVVVEAPPGAESVGVAVLRTEARALGGPLARGWIDFAPGAWARGGDECAEATLDGWIADGHGPKPPVDPAWFDATPARTSLRRAGFRVVSGVPPRRPFGVVEGEAGACSLALSDAGEGLSLRAAGGSRLAGARGAIGWCTATASTTTVWRDGGAVVVIVSAPADRIGGLLGLREVAEIAGAALGEGAAWLGEQDFAGDAAALLRASTLKDAASGALPAVAPASDTRVEALVMAATANVASDPASVVVACDPPLDRATGVRATICATSASVAWWRKDGVASGARAALPLWLSPLEPHREPDAIARIPELLTLARRLARDGFTPTMLEGVTELPEGVRVVGRAHEDAVVAVGLGQRAPWTFPYTNGLPWDLGDPPVIVAVKPGEVVKLTASPPPNTPADARRTVVFRRAARP
jgi:hypothetical protein